MLPLLESNVGAVECYTNLITKFNTVKQEEHEDIPTWSCRLEITISKVARIEHVPNVQKK